MFARQVTAKGWDAEAVARQLANGLRSAGDEPRLVVVFAHWRLDPAVLASALAPVFAPAPVVGCTTIGVISASTGEASAGEVSAGAMALYGDGVRVGVGLAAELSKSSLARSRDALVTAAAALGQRPETLEPGRHAAITLVDGRCGAEEAFCIGSAAAAPQIRFVGGAAATELGSPRASYVWMNGEALADAGVVMLLESDVPFHAVTSSHLVPTAGKAVVTAGEGRMIEGLDGRPALERLRELIADLGGTLDEAQPSEYSFARFVDGMPYVRSIVRIVGKRILLAASVEPGHVLRLMKPGDLIGQTRTDLATAAARVGGEVEALLAFSCIGRHWDAAARGLERELAAEYAAYPTLGFQSYGEQTGMLLVNHTLTGLAIGKRR